MFKLIKWFFYLILILIVFGWVLSFFEEDTKPESTTPQAKKILELKCKYNPGALYEDTFNFYEDGNVLRSSTNKNSKAQTSFRFKDDGDEFILIGNKTVTDINKVTTIIPDSELFVVAKGNTENAYNIFYTIDYDTDPTRLFVCTKR